VTGGRCGPPARSHTAGQLQLRDDLEPRKGRLHVQYFNADATLIRVLFVVLALLGGPGLVIYLVLWILVPEEPQGTALPRIGLVQGGDYFGRPVNLAVRPVPVRCWWARAWSRFDQRRAG
jgi:PspC domain